MPTPDPGTPASPASVPKWILYGVALCVLAGAFLRFDAVLTTEVDVPIRSDALEHVRYALNLRLHGTYSKQPASPPTPDATRAPLYPVLMAAVIDPEASADALVLRVGLLQAGLSTLTVLLAFLVARTVLPPGLALASCALVAISPHLINLGVYLLSETLFAALMMGWLLLVHRAMRGGSPRWAALAGLLLGLMALTRPWIVHFALGLAIVSWAVLRDPRLRRVSLGMLAGCLVIIGSWHMRNLVSVGVWSDSPRTANAIHHGMYPDFVFEGRPETFGFPYRYDPASEQITGSTSRVLDLLVERARAEPGRYLKWFLVDKPLYLFRWDAVQGAADAFVYPIIDTPYLDQPFFIATRWLARLLHPWLMLLAAVSFVVLTIDALRRRWRGADVDGYLAVWWCLYGYFVLVHLVGAPFPRYSAQIYPYLYPLALMPLAWLFERGLAAVRTSGRVDPATPA